MQKYFIKVLSITLYLKMTLLYLNVNLNFGVAKHCTYYMLPPPICICFKYGRSLDEFGDGWHSSTQAFIMFLKLFNCVAISMVGILWYCLLNINICMSSRKNSNIEGNIIQIAPQHYTFDRWKFRFHFFNRVIYSTICTLYYNKFHSYCISKLFF